MNEAAGYKTPEMTSATIMNAAPHKSPPAMMRISRRTVPISFNPCRVGAKIEGRGEKIKEVNQTGAQIVRRLAANSVIELQNLFSTGAPRRHSLSGGR